MQNPSKLDLNLTNSLQIQSKYKINRKTNGNNGSGGSANLNKNRCKLIQLTTRSRMSDFPSLLPSGRLAPRTCKRVGWISFLPPAPPPTRVELAFGDTPRTATRHQGSPEADRDL